MSLNYAGLYSRLKDPNTSLRDKLKLTRFAWKHGAVYIPNKQQVLVDLLASLIINRKKYSFKPDEEDELWDCFAVLLSSHLTKNVEHLLIIKASISQIILEKLVNAEPSMNAGLLHTCSTVLSSHFSRIFSSKQEQMISLIACLCQLVLKFELEEQMSSGAPSMLSLLNMAIRAQMTTQQGYVNQHKVLQVTCDKLLPPALQLVAAVQCRNLSDALMETVTELKKVLKAIIFHKEHNHSYKMYLSIKYGDGEKTQLPKAIDHVFQVLEELIYKQVQNKDGTVGSQSAVCDYLPLFYDDFLSSYKFDEKTISSYKMLQHLISLLGIKPDSADICGRIEEKILFRGVNRLMEVVQKHDVYDIAADNNTGSGQLIYFRHVLDTLLKAKHSRTSDWYSCLLNMMRLNHRILEPKLQVFISDLLVHQSDDVESLDMFLTELVSVYDRLRQFPKWVSVFLSSVQNLDKPVTFPMPDRFLSRFDDAVRSLAQTVMVDTWKSWLEEIKQYTTQFVKGDFSRCSSLEPVVVLFHHFLMNMKVTGYSITEITAKKVKDIMVSMETDLLKPLLTLCLDKKSSQDPNLLVMALLLSHGWGEVHLLLNQYSKYGVIPPGQKSCVASLLDLSFTHVYLEPKEWQRISKRVSKGDNHKLQYLWNSLILQKLRFALQITSLTDTYVDAVSMEMDRYFESFSKMEFESAGKALWDGNFQSITADNCIIAQWALIVNKLPMLMSVLSHTSYKLLSDFVIQTYKSDCEVSSNRMHTKSLFSLSKQMMESAVLQESSDMQHAMVTSLWQYVRQEIGHEKKSPKKRKLSPLLTPVLEILDQLGSGDIKQQNLDDGLTFVEYLQPTADLLNKIIKSEDRDHHFSVDMDHVHTCLSILALLPLENLNTTYHFHCLCGLVVLSTICLCRKVVPTKKSIHTPRDDLVLSDCVQSLTVLLDSCSTSHVFQLVDAESYLRWLMEIHSHSLHQVELKSKSHLLMELSAHIMIEDVQKLPSPDNLHKLLNQTTLEHENLELRLSKLQLGACLATEIREVLGRLPLKDKSCDQYLSYMKVLLGPAHDILSEIRQSGSDENDLMAAAVNIYCQDFPAFISDNQRRYFDLIFDWSCGVLQDEQNEISVENKITALTFLHSCCRDCKHLADVYTGSKKLLMWMTLRSCISKISLMGSRTEDKMTLKQSSDEEPSNYGDKMFVKEVFQIISGKSEKLSNSTEGHKECCKNFLSHHKVNKVLAKNFSKDWRLLRKYLCYQGNIEKDGPQILLMQIHCVLRALIATFEIEQFTAIFKELIQDMEVGNLMSHTDKVLSAILILQQLVSCELTEDQCGVLAESVSKVMINLQCLIEELSHSADQNLNLTIILPALCLQTDILSLGQNLVSPNTAVLSLHSCLLVPLEGASVTPVFHAVYEVLNALLIYHTTCVLSTIPAFLSCAKRLLRVIIEEGRQDRIRQENEVKDLVDCAHLIERLFSLIASHKVDFSKVAVYVVADYVTDSQQVTLFPAVKKALLPGIYKMLDLCDKHSIAQLHTVLGEGVKDVFKVLYSDYTKYHKYTGKV